MERIRKFYLHALARSVFVFIYDGSVEHSLGKHSSVHSYEIGKIVLRNYASEYALDAFVRIFYADAAAYAFFKSAHSVAAVKTYLCRTHVERVGRTVDVHYCADGLGLHYESLQCNAYRYLKYVVAVRSLYHKSAVLDFCAYASGQIVASYRKFLRKGNAQILGRNHSLSGIYETYFYLTGDRHLAVGIIHAAYDSF